MTRVIFIVLFFLLTGCVYKSSIPSDIIPPDSMEKVLWDMIQADQFSKLYLLKDSAKTNVKLETVKLYQEIFQIHHTTKEAFQKSYTFYMNRPELTKTIFDSLSVYANKQRDEVFKAKSANRPKPAIGNPLVKPPAARPPVMKHPVIKRLIDRTK
jgi:hypothetical protein